jgi:hypothetical protein
VCLCIVTSIYDILCFVLLKFGGGGSKLFILTAFFFVWVILLADLTKKSPATFLYYYPRGSLKRLGSPQQYMALIPTLVAFGAILHLGWVAILHGIWILFILVRVDALNNSNQKFKPIGEGSQSTYTLKQSHLKTKWQMTSLNQVVLSRMWRQPKHTNTHTHLILSCWLQALKVDQFDATLFSNRSLCWLRLGDGKKALLDAIECKHLRPNWGKAYYRQGAALMSLEVQQQKITLQIKNLCCSSSAT